MKLSKFTQQVLENFNNINSGILVSYTNTTVDGTRIITMDADYNIQASVVIPEKFDNDVCMDDLKQFLSIVSSMETPDVLFKESSLTVEDANSKVTIVFDEPDTIFTDKALPYVTGKKSLQLPPPELGFVLASDDLKKLLKFSNILSLPHLKLHVKNDKLVFEAVDLENPNCNTYEIILGDSPDNQDSLPITFPKERFVFISSDYKVEVFKKQAKFTSQETPSLQYIVTSML